MVVVAAVAAVAAAAVAVVVVGVVVVVVGVVPPILNRGLPVEYEKYLFTSRSVPMYSNFAS